MVDIRLALVKYVEDNFRMRTFQNVNKKKSKKKLTELVACVTV